MEKIHGRELWQWKCKGPDQQLVAPRHCQPSSSIRLTLLPSALSALKYPTTVATL